MSTSASNGSAGPVVASAPSESEGCGVLVAECPGPDSYLMVAVYIDPAHVVEMRGRVADLVVADGMWCGAGAASPRCRTGLIRVVTSGGVGAVVVDAVGFDDPGQARAACLRAVVADAEAAGVDRVLLVRDDTHARQDTARSGELARQAGVSPTLRCSHADTDAEPLTVVAEVVAWCWTLGGEQRRVIGSVLTAAHLV